MSEKIKNQNISFQYLYTGASKAKPIPRPAGY